MTIFYAENITKTEFLSVLNIQNSCKDDFIQFLFIYYFSNRSLDTTSVASLKNDKGD